MPENPILTLNVQADAYRLRIEYVTKDTLPKMLNGEYGFHIYHVRILTELILRELMTHHAACSLTEEDIIAISIASSLHDIGKLKIPQSILGSPGRLLASEYSIVKKHAIFGEELIRKAAENDTVIDPKIIQYAIDIARCHHERIDGTGYPDGLCGQDIPLCAQVVALADVYDALTSSRSYKKAFSQAVAVEMISSGMCGVFDAKLIKALLHVVYHRMPQV